MKAQSITDVEILGIYSAVNGPTVKLGSDVWVKNVSGCIEEAAGLGMNVWVAPTTGWAWAYNGPGDPFKAAACHLKHQSVWSRVRRYGRASRANQDNPNKANAQDRAINSPRNLFLILAMIVLIMAVMTPFICVAR